MINKFFITHQLQIVLSWLGFRKSPLEQIPQMRVPHEDLDADPNRVVGKNY